MSNPISFLATFPAIQSAIKVGDDGMRIQLQIPESELPAAVGLIALRDKRLLITVEVALDEGRNNRQRVSASSDFTTVDAIKKGRDD